MDEKLQEDLLHRLKKIEGQIRGISRMVEEQKYCVDIMMQVVAAKSALNKVGLSLMESHTHGCVARAIREERGDEAIDELMEVILKYVR